MDIINTYYNKKIQTDINIIKDIYNEGKIRNKKIKFLVFGLGYDSKLYYNLPNFETYFIENNIYYININSEINKNNICYYKYNTTVLKSLNNLINLDDIKVPNKIMEHVPYDIIFIDGPEGYNENCCGREIPIYWSKYFLSCKNTIIYVDDCDRELESKLIEKYFKENNKMKLNYRDGCMKIII